MSEMRQSFLKGYLTALITDGVVNLSDGIEVSIGKAGEAFLADAKAALLGMGNLVAGQVVRHYGPKIAEKIEQKGILGALGEIFQSAAPKPKVRVVGEPKTGLDLLIKKR